MKHNIKIILILIFLFLIAQYIGVFVANHYKEKELPYKIERPKFESKTSFVQLFSIIILVSIIAFILIKLRAEKIWKFWFFFAVWFCLLIAFSTFFYQLAALIIAFIAAFLKVFKPTVILHNTTELFIYAGLAAVFTPLFSILSISILLILISCYDMIAVWKTKHMISFAKFQTKLKIFAGLIIPYQKNRMAILGGGDVGFPILFTAVAYKFIGSKALFIPIFSSLSLFFLLYKGKKKKFYPAMPFLTIGCFIGLIISFLT